MRTSTKISGCPANLKMTALFRSMTWLGIALLLASSARLRAQDTEGNSAKESIMEAVKGAASKDDLKTALENTKTNGATDQQILEGKILWAVHKTEDVEYFQSISAQVEQAVSTWKAGEAVVLKTPDDLKATVHFMAAVKALSVHDAALAQKEILQAVWLDPETQKYVDFIKKIKHLDDKVPLDLKIATTDGKTVTLADYLRDNKAVYIQIWASWSAPCAKLFPALKSRAKLLPPQGVAVIGMNNEMGQDGGAGGNIISAKRIKIQRGMEMPWLVEPKDTPYSDLLGIDSVPRAIVIDPQGRVLYNDNPIHEGLVGVMKKLGVQLDLNAGMPKEEE